MPNLGRDDVVPAPFRPISVRYRLIACDPEPEEMRIILIVGMASSGKSTIINTICNRNLMHDMNDIMLIRCQPHPDLADKRSTLLIDTRGFLDPYVEHNLVLSFLMSRLYIHNISKIDKVLVVKFIDLTSQGMNQGLRLQYDDDTEISCLVKILQTLPKFCSAHWILTHSGEFSGQAECLLLKKNELARQIKKKCAGTSSGELALNPPNIIDFTLFRQDSFVESHSSQIKESIQNLYRIF